MISILHHDPYQVGYFLDGVAEAGQIHLLSVPGIGRGHSKHRNPTTAAGSRLLQVTSFGVLLLLTSIANSDSWVITPADCPVGKVK